MRKYDSFHKRRIPECVKNTEMYVNRVSDIVSDIAEREPSVTPS